MSSQKIALVTGGSRGLGKDMALQIARKGLDVILTYRTNEAKAKEVVSEIEGMGRVAVALPLDVTDQDSFESFFSGQVEPELRDRFKSEHIDFLVNNAGTGIYASFAETSFDQFKTMLDQHLMAPFFLSQLALKYLKDGGGIINISSGLSRFSLPGYSAYATMKGAVETLTRYQAKELGERKIRANVVAPGAIETDFGGGAVRDNKELNAFVTSMTAMGRAGLPTDIGGVVAFLCMEEAYWITGQRIEVSGGMNL